MPLSLIHIYASIQFDQRLYKEDITGSMAHAKMLGATGIISAADAEAIVQGLQSILSDIEAGKVEFTADNEDIHMNVEALLTARIGDAGKRLHTGRSRNDQVADVYKRQVDAHTSSGDGQQGIGEGVVVELGGADEDAVLTGLVVGVGVVLRLHPVQALSLIHI